jgi:hypothetical protein
MEDNFAVDTVDDHRIVVGDAGGHPLDTRHHGDVQVAGDNRRVRGETPGLDGKGHHLLSSQPHRLGRGEVVGDDDDIGGQLGELVVGHTLERTQQIAHDIA